MHWLQGFQRDKCVILGTDEHLSGGGGGGAGRHVKTEEREKKKRVPLGGRRSSADFLRAAFPPAL